MPKESQVGLCKKCHARKECEYSSVDKDQCDFVDVIRGKEHRCLLEKGHSQPHSWWQHPCIVVLYGVQDSGKGK